jgi:hypothetical protein
LSELREQSIYAGNCRNGVRLNAHCFIDDLMCRADTLMYEQKKEKKEYQSGHGIDQERSPTGEEETR